MDFNDLCAIEPALIGIWDMPVGSDLQIVRDEQGIHIFDTPTGREIPMENSYVPPGHALRVTLRLTHGSLRGPLGVVLEGKRLAGLVGPDVSKTEGIKASMTWASPGTVR